MKAVNDFWQDQQQGSQLKQLMAEVFQDPDVKKFLADHQDDLTQEAIQRGQSKLYEYVHQKNIIKQGGISVAPGYTPKLVYAAHQIDVSYVPTKEHLAKQAAQELHDRVSTMDMPKNIREANFHDFWLEGKNSSPSRTAAFGKLVSFSQEYDGSHFMPGYYLTGKFGVGKTYLLGALANALAQRGIKSTLVHFPTFAVKMKSAISSNTTDQLRDQVKSAPVLMLDDIGADTLSPWLRDEVLGVILEYRMQEELPTFFSSNFTMAELTTHLAQDNNGGSEPLKAQRIMERIRFLSRELVISGKNLRVKE